MDPKALAMKMQEEMALKPNLARSGKKPAHDMQLHTFTNWINLQLEKVGEKVTGELGQELKNGSLLCQMLEVCSAKKMGKYTKTPKMTANEIDNLSTAFAFLDQEKIKLVNIAAPDIQSANTKLVLGLIWTIIYHYQVAPAFKEALAQKKSAKEALLEWVREKVHSIDKSIPVTNFTSDMQDGRVISYLTNAVAGRPWVITRVEDQVPANALENLNVGMKAAKKFLDVPLLIQPEDIIDYADEQSVMTYLSYFKKAKRGTPTVDPEEERLAREAALKAAQDSKTAEELAKAKQAEFDAAALKAADAARKLAAEKAQAEKDRIAKEDTDKAAKEFAARKAKEAEDARLLAVEQASKTTVPPEKRAPNWREYSGVDLGGRCKIRVYFSTTTSSQMIRKNTEKLKSVLEGLKVHLRPDFEPMIPVDMDMKPELRDAIFKKADCKVTPLLFVDDEFIGNFDKLMDLHENGLLAPLLQY